MNFLENRRKTRNMQHTSVGLVVSVAVAAISISFKVNSPEIHDPEAELYNL